MGLFELYNTEVRGGTPHHSITPSKQESSLLALTVYGCTEVLKVVGELAATWNLSVVCTCMVHVNLISRCNVNCMSQ